MNKCFISHIIYNITLYPNNLQVQGQASFFLAGSFPQKCTKSRETDIVAKKANRWRKINKKNENQAIRLKNKNEEDFILILS